MNVCFVSNYSKTLFFEQVAYGLKELGVEVFWITVDKYWYKYLCDRFGENNVLHVSYKQNTYDCKPIGEFKINELIYSDRVLNKLKDFQIAQSYLCNIQKDLYTFIKNNNITKVFGEVTWAHEMLISRMCNDIPELKATFLLPLTIRIPFNRFAFFIGESQIKIFETFNMKNIEKVKIKLKAPDYLERNNELLKNRFSLGGMSKRFFRFIKKLKNRDSLDLTNYTLRDIISIKTREFIRHHEYNLFVSTQSIGAIQGNYIFYALHKQPESSIDVFGRYSEGQYNNILNLWRILPIGWKLVVKEHTNAIGDRNISFYKKIKKLSGVLLVNEKADTKYLIKNSNLVATVSGTVAYEAAMMEIPSITFAKCFFNGFSNCFNVNTSDFADCKNLEDLLKNLKRKQGNRTKRELEEYILGVSYEGIISDPISFPACMDPDNIIKVTKAFYQVLR